MSNCKVVLALSLVKSVLVILMFIRQHFFLLTFLFLFSTLNAYGMDSNNSSISNLKANESLDYQDAFIYGIVEGVTEFLPISSTGHLIIVSELLSNSENGSEEAINAYLIVIQAGAILAVALLYRKKVFSMFLGILGLDPKGKRLAFLVLLAFLPAAILGPLLDHKIEEFLFGLLPVAIALFTGAILMFWAEKRKKDKDLGCDFDQGKKVEELTFYNALVIGLMQCFAMWPGTSRSMMTIVGGYFVGLKRSQAAEFSFLLGLLTLSAAAGYKILTKWDVMETHLSLGPVFFGCLVAGISAALSVFWLVGYLSRKGLGLFVWYRMILSVVLLGVYFHSIS